MAGCAGLFIGRVFLMDLLPLMLLRPFLVTQRANTLVKKRGLVAKGMRPILLERSVELRYCSGISQRRQGARSTFEKDYQGHVKAYH